MDLRNPACCLAALALLACSGTAPEPEAPVLVAQAPEDLPDILLFTLDTLRADALGCYGSKLPTSPNLDALAHQGTRFDRAYTVTPLTIPAHSSLFTGMLPPRHGVRDNGDFFLADGATTLAELLRGAGYATMASVGAEVTSHHWGFDQGFEVFFDDMGASRREEDNRWRVERPGNEVVADALAWLREREGDDRPWFAWVHLFDPHAPYRPPAPFDERFSGRPYAGEVAYTDQQVGAVLHELRQLGALEDCWVFVMADHGEGLGDHGESMHGVLLYDATTRVPLIVRQPGGRAPPTRVQTPVSLVDVMPTILDLAGIPHPEGLDGEPLQPLLEDPEAEPHRQRAIYVESLYAYRHYGWAPQRALVADGLKLIDSTTPELYRLSLGERRSQADKMPRELARMDERLQALLATLEPVESSAGKAQGSSERLAQLAALGYVTDASREPVDELTSLPDPVDRLPVLAEVEKARAALQAGEVDEARLLAEAILEQEPGLTELRLLLSGILVRQGKADEARVVLEVLAHEQHNASTRALLGAISWRAGELGLAREHLESALELDPYLAQAWVPYLQVLFGSNDLPALGRALRRAGQHVPEEPAVVGMQGVVAALEGASDQAEPLLLAALERRPDLPFCNLALGVVYQGQGAMDQAETHLLEELRLFQTIAARYKLVEIYAEQRRYDEQLAQLELIASSEPPNPLTHHSIAQAQYNQGRFERALVSVEACIQVAPEYPGCQVVYANVLDKLDRQDEAAAAFERAKALTASARSSPFAPSYPFVEPVEPRME